MANLSVLFEDNVGRQAVRRLATRLQTLASDSVTKLSPMLITSVVPGEGKSTLAAALGMVMVRELGLRTLVVDVNWQQPAQHDIFNIACSYDVPDLLEHGAAAVVRDLGRDSPSVLTAPRGALASDEPEGVPAKKRRAPSRTFSQVRDFGRLLGEREQQPGQKQPRVALLDTLGALGEQYDFVILDGPALEESPPGPLDALQLAMIAKTSLLVVLMRSTPRDVIKRGKMALENTRAKLLGAVMNNLHNPLY